MCEWFNTDPQDFAIVVNGGQGRSRSSVLTFYHAGGRAEGGEDDIHDQVVEAVADDEQPRKKRCKKKSRDQDEHGQHGDKEERTRFCHHAQAT